jgi:hypothetical protein
MQTPPAITDVLVSEELLGFHLEDGRFISVPVAFYPTLALATAEERGRFEINGSAVYWPELCAQSRGTRRPSRTAFPNRLGKGAPPAAATRLIVLHTSKR